MQGRASPSTGFTLVELLVTIAVAAILMMVAVPSFFEQNARRQLEGAATELSADLHYTRARAVAASALASLVTNAGGNQYSITSGGTNYKTVTLAGPLSLTPSTTITYDQLRAMATASGALTLSSSRTSAQLSVTVSPMGRVSMCSPSGSLTGYTAC